jgi:4-amino-4-deoxy-L-arabinose transferase-like glycosyltransferase
MAAQAGGRQPWAAGWVQWAPLAGITAVAAVLRLYKLGEWSFWIDEAITYFRARDLAELPVLRRSISLLLTQLALRSFGGEEWVARLPSVVAGVVTVPVLYLIARRLFSPQVGLIGAGLLALSPWHLYWSQNARFYSFLLLFHTLALFYFYRGLEDDRPADLVASAIFLGLGILERPLALFLLPVIGLYVAVLYLAVLRFQRPPGLRMRNLAAFLVPALALSLVLLAGFPAAVDATERERLFGWVNARPIWILAGTATYTGLAVVCLALAGTAILIRERSRPGLLSGLNAWVPWIGTVVAASVQYSATRYAFLSLGSWLILGAWGLHRVVDLLRDRSRILALAVVAVVVVAPLSDNALYFLYQNGNRDDWKGAFELIQTERLPDDLVFTPNLDLAEYYMGQGYTGLGQFDPAAVGAPGRRAWFVEDLNVEQKWPVQHRWILENARLVENLDVHFQARNFKMRVYLYEPPSVSP